MRPSPKLRPTAWDALVVLCVAALAIALALFQWRTGPSQGLTAVVSVDGTEIDRVSLEDAAGEKTYQAGAYTLTVEYAAGSARVRTSNCPTQDCVHTGTITRGGQSIVCLPARIVIRLEGGAPAPDAVDAVLG
ncbi:NusG domain II-containing protein [uncultured Oscillibacter sp.]|uniref:NusG domain II-containing protein n=1 Tax=uncultured Oscillibacter sp. TaxID=876091 RepID=UPI0026249083|nr:NusG domain II-containing protein [uncultured Oscillibacter sp.]